MTIANVDIKQTRIEFAKGTTDFSQCLDLALNKTNIKCLPIIFDELSWLPICKTYDETVEVLSKISDSEDIKNCLQPNSTFLFTALRPSFEELNLDDSKMAGVQIRIFPYSSSIEIKKEILVIGNVQL